MAQMKTFIQLILFSVLLASTGCWETVYGPVLVNKTSASVGVEVVTTIDRLRVFVPAQGNSWRRDPLEGEIQKIVVTRDSKEPIIYDREEIEKRVGKETGLNDMVILIQANGIEITSKPKKK